MKTVFCVGCRHSGTVCTLGHLLPYDDGIGEIIELFVVKEEEEGLHDCTAPITIADETSYPNPLFIAENALTRTHR